LTLNADCFVRLVVGATAISRGNIAVETTSTWGASGKEKQSTVAKERLSQIDPLSGRWS
jgi:hypothetical protein